MSLRIITAPTAACITLAEAKLHLKIESDQTVEDSEIMEMVLGATQDAETLMQRAVMPQTWALEVPAFPLGEPISLPRPVVSAITHIKYLSAADGVLTTLDPSAYRLIASDYTATVVPAYSTTWPAVRAEPDAVRVTFVAGWPDAASVPAVVKRWIKLRLGALYAVREQWSTDKPVHEAAFADRMLDHYCLINL
jgi:uncharacterized phiE125 gp8 family phage protein